MLNIIGIVLLVFLALLVLWFACRWCYHTGYVNGFSTATRKYLEDSQKRARNLREHRGKWKRNRKKGKSKQKGIDNE